MLTAAGTVRVFHPIPFSFFAWEETNSGSNVVQTSIYPNVYLSNVRKELYKRTHSAHVGFNMPRPTFFKRFSFYLSVETNMRTKRHADFRGRHTYEVNRFST